MKNIVLNLLLVIIFIIPYILLLSLIADLGKTLQNINIELKEQYVEKDAN